MEMSDFAIALAAGLFPTFFWLWFWLREDRAQPEPWQLIALAFGAGMAVVPIALPLQQLARELYADNNLVFIWVIIEEVLKYAAALAIVLWRKAVNEPIDVIIYLIVIALGFSAFENALFAFTALLNGTIQELVLASTFRSIGATLLHVLASASIGVCLALAYYRSLVVKLIAGLLGTVIAIVLHVLFNLFVVKTNGTDTLAVFLFVWLGIGILFLFCERVKRVPKPQNRVQR